MFVQVNCTDDSYSKHVSREPRGQGETTRALFWTGPFSPGSDQAIISGVS
jgi:hypothetical protein